MHEVITNNLDIWTSALLTKSTVGRGSNGKQEAYGIKKLRELILELAVRGKLVPQDPNDELASVLLERVLKENTQLPKKRGRKRSENPDITDGEISFELPPGWEYVRNGSLFSLRKGKKPNNISESQIGLPYLDIEALDRGNLLRFTDDDTCPRATEEDILVVCDGSRSGLILNGQNGVIGSTLAVVDTPREIQPFVKLLFMESYERLNSTMKGAAIPHLDTNRLMLEIVGLPPLNEQHRIVAKVDELMALCDQLEQQQTHSIEAHQTLVEALLGTLTRVASPQELTEAWTRIASHLDTLFTTEHSIDQLKQTILQLAVMGKLVPQDSSDEPASALLEMIVKEKLKKAKSGEIRSETLLTNVEVDDVPHELPQGWVWVRLGDISVVERGGSPRPIKSYLTDADDGLNWIKIGDTEKGGKYITSTEEKIRKEGLIKTRLVYPGEFLLTNSMSYGRPYITKIKGCIHDGWLRIHPSENIEKDYLYHLLSSSYVAEFFKAVAAGAVVMNLNADKVRDLPIAIPPIAEQHRIVTKVDKLMSLCDALKSRLQEAKLAQIQIADAVVEQVVA